jgi:hypothetical protein
MIRALRGRRFGSASDGQDLEAAPAVQGPIGFEGPDPQEEAVARAQARRDERERERVESWAAFDAQQQRRVRADYQGG